MSNLNGFIRTPNGHSMLLNIFFLTVFQETIFKGKDIGICLLFNQNVMDFYSRFCFVIFLNM